MGARVAAKRMSAAGGPTLGPLFEDAESQAETGAVNTAGTGMTGDGATVLRQWELFLDSEFAWERFTRGIYHALTMWCSFIAHYNRRGFFDVYFDEDAEATLLFIEQFVTGRSAELGFRGWAERPENETAALLPRAMCAAMRPRAARLRAVAQERARTRDLRIVTKLAERHGLRVSGGGHDVTFATESEGEGA